MPQENGHRTTRQSSRSSPLKANGTQHENVPDLQRSSNREIKERGYYSELATINPESNFEVSSSLFVADIELLCVCAYGLLDSTTSTHRP